MSSSSQGTLHLLLSLQKKGWRMKRGSQQILAGSRNLGSVFDKSRSLVFAWFVFTFFESRNFLPKSLGLGFLTTILASRESRILPFGTPRRLILLYLYTCKSIVNLDDFLPKLFEQNHNENSGKQY